MIPKAMSTGAEHSLPEEKNPCPETQEDLAQVRPVLGENGKRIYASDF